MVLVSPTRSNSPSCRTRSSLTWSLGEVLLISSRKIDAGVGGLEPAGPVVDGAGERALDVAEQLALQQALGQGPAVDADVGPVDRGLRSWMARAISSLPVPVSPTIRTQAREGATWRVVRNDLAHGRALAEDARARSRPAAEIARPRAGGVRELAGSGCRWPWTAGPSRMHSSRTIERPMSLGVSRPDPARWASGRLRRVAPRIEAIKVGDSGAGARGPPVRPVAVRPGRRGRRRIGCRTDALDAGPAPELRDRPPPVAVRSWGSGSAWIRRRAALLVGRDQGAEPLDAARELGRGGAAELDGPGGVEDDVGQAPLGVGSGTSPRAVEAARLVSGVFRAAARAGSAGAQVGGEGARRAARRSGPGARPPRGRSRPARRRRASPAGRRAASPGWPGRAAGPGT